MERIFLVKDDSVPVICENIREVFFFQILQFCTLTKCLQVFFSIVFVSINLPLLFPMAFLLIYKHIQIIFFIILYLFCTQTMGKSILLHIISNTWYRPSKVLPYTSSQKNVCDLASPLFSLYTADSSITFDVGILKKKNLYLMMQFLIVFVSDYNWGWMLSLNHHIYVGERM